MSTFHNDGNIQNQTAHQVVYGNLNFYHESTPSHEPDRSGQDRTTSLKTLDDDILRSLAFPGMVDRRSNIEKHHPETCKWIFDLDQYKTWEHNPSGLLWIKGKPGAGKSTLMSHLYHVTKRGTVHLEFFFNARGALLQYTPLGMARSLLNQIFRQDFPTREFIRQSFREKTASFGAYDQGQAWEWQLPELKSLLSDIVLASAKNKQVTIFVDALDETGEHNARELATFFNEINFKIKKAEATAKICISCRHYPIPSHLQSVEIHVEKHNKNDISTYIQDALCVDKYTGHDFTSDESDGRTKIQDYLIKQANGIFQWVRLIVPLVNKRLNDGLSSKTILEWLHKVPAGLEEVYTHILQNVIDKTYGTQSLRLFKWVCMAIEPLSVNDLRYALATHDITFSVRKRCAETENFISSEEKMKLQITSLSGGLLEFVETDQTDHLIAQVIHQTVKDFFLTHGFVILEAINQHDKLSTSSISLSAELIKKIHGELYWCCLNYLTVELSPPFTARSNAVSNDHERQYYGYYVDGYDFEGWRWLEFEYANRNVLEHAKAADEYRSPDLSQEVLLLNNIVARPPPYIKIDKYTKLRLCEGGTVLHVAAFADLRDLASYAVKNKIDINAWNNMGDAAIHIAAREGHLEIVKILLKAGTRVEARNKRYNTALELAFTKLQWNVVRLLVNAGADVDSVDESLSTALIRASVSGNEEMVHWLIEAGANMNETGGTHGSALIAASYRGHERTVRLLIKAGADVNARDGYDTALEAASKEGHYRIAKILVEAGADVNAQGEYGTALEVALEEGHYRVAKLLVEAGAVHEDGGLAFSSSSLGGPR